MKMKKIEMEMSDESYEKGRKKMSMTTLGKEDEHGSCWKGPAQKPGGITDQITAGRGHQITDVRTNNIVLNTKLMPRCCCCCIVIVVVL